MSISASFDEGAVAVEPGDDVALLVQVANSGTTVEELHLEPVGPCAAWTTVEPERLSLYPGASGSAQVHVRPPRAPGTAPGATTLGLRLVPTSDANLPVVAERPLEVMPFTDLSAELVPRTSQSAWRGRHEAAVDNRGNTPLTIALAAQGMGERVRFVLDPAELTIPCGETKLARLSARPVRRIWRGTPATHSFQVLVTPEPAPDGSARPPAVLDGTYEQQAVLPRWLPRAIITTVLLAGVLVGLWYGLLRPTVRSAARDAITPESIASAASATPGTTAGGTTTGTTAGTSAGSTASATAGTGTNAGTGTTAPAATGGGTSAGTGSTAGSAGSAGGANPASGTNAAAGVPTSARISAKDSVGGGTKSASYTVASGKSFNVTDILVQNPQGDAGTLVVATADGQILSLALEDFRSSDYHFVTPIVIPAGGRATLTVGCREVGRPVKAPVPSQCTESLFLGGTLQSPRR
jgi:hypothetical protein